MDAFSVSLANGMNEPCMKKGRMCVIAGTFSFFQFMMPMLGWICVHTILQYFAAFEKLIPWIALILLVFGLSGCGKTTQQTTLEFWTLQLNDFAPYIQRKITEYEALHPDVKIKWIDIPFSEGEKRTLSAVMSDDVPDVVNLTPSFSSTLQQKKVLTPIRA